MRIEFPASKKTGSWKRRHGATLVVVAITITVLISSVALALDFSRMYLFKSELQTLADAAAMSSVIDLKALKTETQAEANAFALLSANRVENTATATMTASDITPVTWTFATRTKTSAGSWATANAVEVRTRYSANWTLGRVFGGSARTVEDTSVAAYGSIGSSNCIKPWAFPLASLMQAAGDPGPYEATDTLTAAQVATLSGAHTAAPFLTLNNSDTPDATQSGSVGWVNTNPNGTLSNPNDNIAAGILGCTSTGIGVGSVLNAFTGQKNSDTVRDAMRTLCGGTNTGNGNGANYEMTCAAGAKPILIPIFSASTGTGSNATYTIKYVGAFKMTKVDADGLWGYLLSISIPPSGTLSNAPGPVVAIALVR